MEATADMAADMADTRATAEAMVVMEAAMADTRATADMEDMVVIIIIITMDKANLLAIYYDSINLFN